MNKERNDLYVFWYEHGEGNGNFGDELNHYIIGKLTNKKINLVRGGIIMHKRKTILKNLVMDFLKGKSSIKKTLDSTEFKILTNRTIIPIGSVIERYRLENCDIWGAGIMFGDREIAPANFLAVRGKYTQKRLTELGMTAPEAIGDPALLLPLVYQPKVAEKKYKIGVIPHFRHHQEVQKLIGDQSEILLINILDPIEKIIDEINACEMTFSTSLHGIIASHAYGIPSLWVDFTGEPLAGGNTKFFDYFSSVNLPEYEVKNVREVKTLFDMHQEQSAGTSGQNMSFPNADRITKIQQDLLDVAPFEIQKNHQ